MPAADVDILGRSALQLALLLQSGTLDAEAVAEASLAAIRHSDPAVFTRLTPERARAEALAAAARLRDGRPAGPLDGVPVAWKDLFDLKGLPTTVGSRVLENAAPAAEDAAVVGRLKQAGMVTVGRVNMTEFAFSGLGLNPHFGTPRNPNDEAVVRIPGGSSSGSAVAVARGLVPVAIGSDTGGSVRIPAAFNGIVGYKATRGRYPMAGVFPLATSLDSLGVLCRTVADAFAVDAALGGFVLPLVARRGAAGLRLIVPTNLVFDDVEQAVAAAFEGALDRLAAKGVRIERRPVAALDAVAALTRRHGAMVNAEAYALHAERLAGPDAARMDPRVVARMKLGAAMTVPDFIAIRDGRAALIEQAREEIGPDSFVAYPTVALVAPALEPLERDDDLYNRINLKTLRNTVLGNVLDWCAVSVPCAGSGPPVGFLLSGLGGEDERLLSAALALEPIIRGETP